MWLKRSAEFTGKYVKELQDKVAGIEKNTTKLIQDANDMMIERAHRVGTEGGKKNCNGEALLRPIVEKFLNWKELNNVLMSVRGKCPDGLFFVEDLAQRNLEKREAQNLLWQRQA